MPHGPNPILIVDDVASEAMTLDLLCRSLGVETLRAASAAEAGAILARMRPAGIITDLVMPGADGLDCLFLIAEHAPSVPVMVITASEKLLLKAASELGEGYGLMDLTCVAKPVGLPALTAFLARTGTPCKPHRQRLH
jgi:two-component system response regulator (stage 0 sporulation protein F)